jgi:tetratricopeptide (TPR) repeat protein
MKHEEATNTFKDSPAPAQLQEVIAAWRLPDLPDELKGRVSRYKNQRYGDLSLWNREKLVSTGSLLSRTQDEQTIINWLYTFIRLNVKRGRIFDLREVLQSDEADCLGYAKLFTTLGRQCGLDTGVAEIITDNRGRNVPHSGVLVRLVEGRSQFVDFWYGSPDIRHKRLGLCVKRKGSWNIEDIDFPDIKKAEDISYLPDDRVDAITLYIEGNRSLEEGHYKRAVGQYSQAIGLYPQNARLYYNRAIAYEKLGQPEKAEVDYARALQDEAALKRILAAQPQDTVDLIQLDEMFVPDLDQKIYLLFKGFITGRPVPAEKIALKLSIPREEVEAGLGLIKGLLDGSTIDRPF